MIIHMLSPFESQAQPEEQGAKRVVVLLLLVQLVLARASWFDLLRLSIPRTLARTLTAHACTRRTPLPRSTIRST